MIGAISVTEARKVSLGTGVVGEAILNGKTPSPSQSPARGQLPSIRPKRKLNPNSQLNMYKTQSMNPYRAIVAKQETGKDVVLASKFINVHQCSIEFNAVSLKSGMRIQTN